MFVLRIAFAAGLMAAVLGGCAKPPHQLDAGAPGISAHAYLSGDDNLRLAERYKYSQLTGRVLHISSIDDIKLRDREVVLTFDDGPRAHLTEKILDALDVYSVKATFLSVGRMADMHPEIIREVALRGHTVGTHTHDHENLGKINSAAAMDKIAWGYRSLVKALAPIGKKPAPFFRFPYLSDTKVLRASLASDRMVVLDVDIDSEDYRKASPDQVLQRTLRRLEARGRGVILFHDIQARTAEMMPEFLDELEARGYKVVHLVPSNRGLFDRALVTAFNSN